MRGLLVLVTMPLLWLPYSIALFVGSTEAERTLEALIDRWIAWAQ